MTPVQCTVTHNPPHSYGDCVRACIASILNLPSEAVPHFYADGGSGNEAADKARIVEWLGTQGYAPFWVGYDGNAPRYEVLSIMGENAPSAHYVLLGRTGDGGDHAVVCRGDAIVHNPCEGSLIVACMNAGAWVTMGICVA